MFGKRESSGPCTCAGPLLLRVILFLMIDFTSPNARRAEVLGAAAIIILILIFTFWYMATHEAPEPFLSQEPVASSIPEALPPQVTEEHGQYFDIEAVSPGETALKATAGVDADAAAVALMDDFVDDTIREFKRQGNFDSLTPEDIQIMGLSDTRKESIAIDFEETQGEDTASYVYTIFVDTLGAHPNAFYRTFTFDLATGSELSITDLFVPRSDYLKRLSAIAEFELAKSLKDFADIDYIRQGVTPEALNFQSFAIEGESLVLIFPPYQVAPYAAGTQKVSIPLSQLSEILKPEYRAE